MVKHSQALNRRTAQASLSLSTPSSRRRARRARPLLEALEDRLVPVTIPLTTFVDEDNGFLGGGAGISLREAIRYSAAGDVVQLSAGTYNLTLYGPGDDLGATGDLDVRHNLTIAGPNSCNAIIDGQWWDRVLDQHPGVNLLVSNVEITRGNAYADPGPDQDGGGIRNRNGVLQLVVCNRIHDSYAVNGGAIANKNNATMRMLDTLVYLNYAGGAGGGVFNAFMSIAGMDRSAFRSNGASQGGALFNVANSTANVNNLTIMTGNYSLAEGGAIYNEASRLNVTQSTLDGNVALTAGGGIYAIAGGVSVIQSTIYYNYAVTDGGGLALQSLPTTIQNSTISSNYAQNNGGGIFRGFNAPLSMLHATLTLNVATLGGGIFTGPPVFPVLTRSVVAENYTWALVPDDVNGALDPTGRYNVLTSGLYGLPAAFNALSPFGFIGPLGSCAGPIPTLAHDLLPGNPAINIALGPPPPTLPTDQKGKPRGALPDSGACESALPGPGAPGPEGPALDMQRLIDGFTARPWAEVESQAGDGSGAEVRQDAAAFAPIASHAGDALAETVASNASRPLDAVRLAVDFVYQFGIE